MTSEESAVGEGQQEQIREKFHSPGSVFTAFSVPADHSLVPLAGLLLEGKRRVVASLFYSQGSL